MGKIERIYICNREKECSISQICGTACQHTRDVKYSKSGGFTIEDLDGVLTVPDNVEIIRRDNGSFIMIEVEEAEDE